MKKNIVIFIYIILVVFFQTGCGYKSEIDILPSKVNNSSIMEKWLFEPYWNGHSFVYIDENGDEIYIYDYKRNVFMEDMAVVRIGVPECARETKAGKYKYGYIDKEYNIIIPFIYDYAADFNEGMAVVGVGVEFNYNDVGLYGYVNRLGEVVVEPKYQYAESFFEGRAHVGKGWWDKSFHGVNGYIDYNGKEIIPLVYGMAFSFKNGSALVNDGKSDGEGGLIDGKWFYIDLDGEYIENHE